MDRRFERRPILLPVLLAMLAAGTAAAADSGAALIEAVRSGSVERVRAVLQSGADVNAAQGDGARALHWAAHKDDAAIADVLIRAGARIDVANDLGATPLWLASLNGSASMVARLLDAGAGPNLALASGETALMAAARSGNVKAVELLIAGGADVNARERSRDQTALMWAVEQRHADVARTILAAGADVHARSNVWRQLENTAGNTNAAGDFEMAHGGSTPLLFAARQGDVDTAAALLDGGANVNDIDAAGTSALVIAVHSDHTALSLFLLSQGADPNAAKAGYTALHAAVLRGNLELVKALVARGADPNALVAHGTPGRRLSADYSLRYQMIGANPFWLAARFGEPEMMRVLADSGASAFSIPKDGTTALKAAIGFVRGLTENRRGRYGVPVDRVREEQVTLEAARIAVDMGVDLNAVDPAGDTALHDAARQRFNTVVEFLIARGADPNIRNKRKQTVLGAVLAETSETSASGVDRQRTIEVLQKLGAGQ
jgi:ankyrin repeat protein